MTIPQVVVSVDLFQVIGTGLPNAQVILTLTRADRYGSGGTGGLVPVGQTTIQCDANGQGSGSAFPNDAGTQGTQYSVTVIDANGNVVFPEAGHTVCARLPVNDCWLHDCLFLAPPMSQGDSDAATQLSRNWANLTGASVDGTEYSSKEYAVGSVAPAGSSKNWASFIGGDVPQAPGSRSAKSWSQDNLVGATYGGSARDWAMGTGFIDGVTYLSSRQYAVNAATSAGASSGSAGAALASQQAAAASATQTAADRIQTDQDVVAANTAQAQSNSNMLTAIAQAGLASIYALSAASVAQQDLSGVTAAALHRSPNAVVGMCIDDPRTHSDGGAWTSKVDHLSWMNEPLNGAWAGPIVAATLARAEALARGNYISSPEDLGNVAFWSQGNGTYTMVAAPDGTNTMLQYFENATNSARGITQSFPTTVNAGDVFIAQAVLSPKGAIGRWASIGFSNFFGANCTFDLTGSGAVSYQANAVGTITSLGGGQYLCSIMSVVPNVAQGQTPVIVIATQNGSQGGSYVGDPTRGMTIWHPDLQRIPAASFSNSNPQLIPFSNFDYGTDGWAGVNCTLSIAGSKLRLTSTLNGAGLGANGSFPTAIGQTYTVGVDVPVANPLYGAIVTLGTGVGGGGTNLGQGNIAAGNSGRIYLTFVAVSATTYIQLANNGSTLGSTFDFDNLSVQLLSPQAPRAYTPVAGGSGTYFQFSGDGKHYRCNSTWGATETFRGNVAHYGRTAWVAEASRVVGYAIDQPGRPMWMVFVRGSSISVGTYLAASATSVNCLAALNGVLTVGLGSSQGLAVVNFAGDKSLYKTIGGSQLRPGTIAQRNVEYASSTVINDGSAGITNSAVNAVAMTTMPDAPVDPVTGLQVPTIAVATAGGVTVLQNDGSGVNSSSAGSFLDVAITPYSLVAQTAGAQWNYVFGRPTLLASAFVFGSAVPSDFGVQVATKTLAGGQRGMFARKESAARIALLRANESTPAASLLALIAPTYNTGWMAGDIRRCYLSDVSVGVVSGGERLSDPGFDTGVGWTLTQQGVGQTASIGSGLLTMSRDNPTNAYGIAYQAFTTVVGRMYAGIIVTGAGTTTLGYRLGTGGSMTAQNIDAATTAASTTPFSFIATAATTYVSLYPTSTGSINVDSVSFKEVVSDRSYKAKSLQTFGTLTRSQVGVGSQLVAYSGFSAGNYLQEAAYSADLDFGTGSQFWKPVVSIPALAVGSPTFSPVPTLPLADFGVAQNIALSMNTAQWTKGTGWTCPTANSFQADGSAGAASADLVMVANNGLSNAGAVRKWTFTVTAFSANGGGAIFYPNSITPISITGPGTYTGIGNGGSTLIRVQGGTGPTISGTLQIDELEAAPISHRGASTGASMTLGVNALGLLVGTMNDGTTSRVVASTASYAGNGFIHPSLAYDTSGSLTLRVGPTQIAQTTGAPMLTMNNAAALLTVGTNFGQTSFFPGSIALLRIGATVPSADAAAWMYEQEKEMFRDGAQVTLPDSGAVVDLDYDPVQDKWKVVSAANESSFVGLVQISQAPVPAGSFTHVAHKSGIKLLSRSTTNPGVDITIPAKNALEEFNRRAEDARALARLEERFDYVGGFTATTAVGSALLTSVAGLSIPPTATVRGAQVTGTGIPAGTTILDIQGTTIQLSAACTAAGSGVSVSFTDFILPTGYEAKSANAARAIQYEGALADWTRRFDGFREGERFIAAPGATAKVQLIARRIAS